jgi:hypothetical protein
VRLSTDRLFAQRLQSDQSDGRIKASDAGHRFVRVVIKRISLSSPGLVP